MPPHIRQDLAAWDTSAIRPADMRVADSAPLVPTQRFAIAAFGDSAHRATSEYVEALTAGSLVSDTTDPSDENEKLREHLQRMIALVEQANQIIHGLQTHRDELLDSIRWHRDMIQLPTKPDRRLWKNTIVRWDRENR